MSEENQSSKSEPKIVQQRAVFLNLATMIPAHPGEAFVVEAFENYKDAQDWDNDRSEGVGHEVYPVVGYVLLNQETWMRKGHSWIRSPVTRKEARDLGYAEFELSQVLAPVYLGPDENGGSRSTMIIFELGEVSYDIALATKNNLDKVIQALEAEVSSRRERRMAEKPGTSPSSSEDPKIQPQ